MKDLGYQFGTNSMTSGPEIIRHLKPGATLYNKAYGINHCMMMLPKELLNEASEQEVLLDEQHVLLRRLEFLPPMHLAVPSVPNVF